MGSSPVVDSQLATPWVGASRGLIYYHELACCAVSRQDVLVPRGCGSGGLPEASCEEYWVICLKEAHAAYQHLHVGRLVCCAVHKTRVDHRKLSRQPAAGWPTMPLSSRPAVVISACCTATCCKYSARLIDHACECDRVGEGRVGVHEAVALVFAMHHGAVRGEMAVSMLMLSVCA